MLDGWADQKNVKIAWDMWEHHNDVLHLLDAACQTIVESKENDQIQRVYDSSPQALLCDALHLLHKPLEQIPALSLITFQ